MKNITEKDVKIDNKHIRVHGCEIEGENGLLVEAGTNGPQGGASKHGCRTYINIENRHGTDMKVYAKNDPWHNSDGVEIILGGDSELSTIIEALEFVTETLKKMK